MRYSVVRFLASLVLFLCCSVPATSEADFTKEFMPLSEQLPWYKSYVSWVIFVAVVFVLLFLNRDSVRKIANGVQRSEQAGVLLKWCFGAFVFCGLFLLEWFFLSGTAKPKEGVLLTLLIGPFFAVWLGSAVRDEACGRVSVFGAALVVLIGFCVYWLIFPVENFLLYGAVPVVSLIIALLVTLSEADLWEERYFLRDVEFFVSLGNRTDDDARTLRMQLLRKHGNNPRWFSERKKAENRSVNSSL